MYDPAHSGNSRIFGPLTIAFCLLAAVVFYSIPQSMADPDIWWHLRNAQIQLASHSFLTHDLFSFTAAGSPWMNHEWLAELPFYAGYRLFGVNGLFAVTTLILEFIFGGLLFLAYLRSRSVAAATCAAIAGALLSTVSFGPRTLLFGWAFLIVELVLVQLSERHEQVIWALPAVFLLWVNTHGSWMIGMVVFTLYVVSSALTVNWGNVEAHAASPRRTARLAIAWALSAFALFINPYGSRLVLYPFDLAFRQKLNTATVEEWKSLDFHSPRGHIFFFFLALLFVLQLVRGRRWGVFELAITAIGIYSGLTYSRFLFLAAILVVPSLAVSLAPLLRSSKPERRLSPLLSAALIFLMFCFVAGRLRTYRAAATAEDSRFPGQSLGFLSTFQPHGRVFNEFIWGGFLIWNKRDLPVFIDSRVDIFEYNGTFKDYLDIVQLRNSLALLKRHQIRYVFFESNSPLIELLKATRDWHVDYEDKTSTLMERNEY